MNTALAIAGDGGWGFGGDSATGVLTILTAGLGAIVLFVALYRWGSPPEGPAGGKTDGARCGGAARGIAQAGARLRNVQLKLQEAGMSTEAAKVKEARDALLRLADTLRAAVVSDCSSRQLDSDCGRLCEAVMKEAPAEAIGDPAAVVSRIEAIADRAERMRLHVAAEQEAVLQVAGAPMSVFSDYAA